MESGKFANQLIGRLKKYLKTHNIKNDIANSQWDSFESYTYMNIQTETVASIISRLEDMLRANNHPHTFNHGERNQLTHIIGSLTMKYLY